MTEYYLKRLYPLKTYTLGTTDFTEMNYYYSLLVVKNKSQKTTPVMVSTFNPRNQFLSKQLNSNWVQHGCHWTNQG